MTQLTSRTDPEHTPSCSPDGSKVAYVHSLGNGESEIRIVGIDGKGDVALPTGEGVWASNPAWSPDGKRIAFERKIPGGDGTAEDIYVIDSDGSQLVQLTDHPGTDIEPAWSPDGKKIVFATGRDEGFNDQLYVMDADGSNQMRVTSHASIYSAPTWSPDGTKILFQSKRDFGRDSPSFSLDPADPRRLDAISRGRLEFVIYVMDADGGSELRLTEIRPWTQTPSWSPDGRLIAFSAGETRRDINTMPFGGDREIPPEEWTKITEGGERPSWCSRRAG